jgi:hypothetical protein
MSRKASAGRCEQIGDRNHHSRHLEQGAQVHADPEPHQP